MNKWYDNEVSMGIMKKKYLHEGETADDFIPRVAGIFSDGLRQEAQEALENCDFLPAGRTLYGAGYKGERKVSMSNCFVAGTKVTTARGLVNIEDVHDGDKVLTADGYKEVNATMCRDFDGDLFELSGNGLYDNIVCTPNHRFLTKNGWVRADRLFKGNLVMATPFKENSKEYAEVDLAEHFVSDEKHRVIVDADGKYQPQTLGNQGWRSYAACAVNRTMVLDDEMRYFIGRWIGDGSTTCRVGQRNPSILQIVFNATTEREAADRIVKAGTKAFGFAPQITKTKQNVIAVRWENAVICSWFRGEFGFGCDGKYIPEKYDGDFQIAIGMLDSDGMIKSHGEVSITLKNEGLILWLRNTLFANGINVCDVRNANHGSARMINIVAAQSREYVCPNMTRTYFDGRQGIEHSPELAKWIRLSDVKVIEDQHTKVYNLSVEDNHQYNVNGVICHNCYILPTPEDNIESIFETAKRIARISSYGGGCGIDISKLRPKGAKVNNSALTSTGAVSFLNIFDVTGATIGQKGRRAALMVGLDCSHPDIEEFLRIKQNNEKLASMNISIKFTNDFMEAVKNGEKFKLHFDTKNEHIERYIDARKFFEEFCKTQWDYGDPGALFIDRIRDFNLLSGYKDYQIDITNPCAEYPGNGGNSCVTGDTLVATPNGVRKIVDLEKHSSTVYSINGKYEPFVCVKNQGERDVYKLTLHNGLSIKATDNHRFMTESGWKELKDLTSDDSISISEKPNCIPSNDFDPEYEMYGWIHGDGWFSSTIGISFNYGDGDIDIKERLLPIFKRVFKCGDRKPLKDDEVSYQLQVERRDAIDRALELGFVPSRACERQLPTTFYDWTNVQQKSFIRGLMSADGMVFGAMHSQIGFCSTSKALVDQVQKYLASLGIVGKLYTTTFSSESRRKPQYKVVLSKQAARDYFDIIGFSGKKKTNKFERGLNFKRDEYSKVESIEPIGVDTVYDIIEVGETNAFYANGMAVHNCNLGSINLYNVIDDKFTKKAHVNLDKLRAITRTAVRMLDEILDYGYDMQPLDINRKCIADWRSIGLGVFGLADALVALGIRYGSPDARLIVSDIMETMLESALSTSADLAAEKGTFGKYRWEDTKKSPFIEIFFGSQLYKKIEKYGLRNGSLLSVAPTGSISLFAGGFTGGVEPMYQVSYERTTHSTEDEGKTFRVYARGVKDLLAYHHLGNLSTEEIKKRFPFIVESHEIKPLDRIAMQSVMQDYVDCAISSTINLPHSATPEEIFDIYVNAWQQGLKGVTVFRDGCKRGNILGVKKNDTETPTYNSIVPAKRRDTECVKGATFKESSSCVPSMYVTVNRADSGDIFEVFTNASGGCQANINTITRLISLCLRSGIKVDKIVEELRENKCPACQMLRRQGKKVSLSCANAIADAIDAMRNTEHTVEIPDGMKCPECGKATLRPDGHCISCSNCGWSKCD